MSFRHREDRSVLDRAGVKFGGADQITHILQNYKIQLLCAEFQEPLLRLAGVKVTHAAGVQLNGLDTDGSDLFRVNSGVDVRFHYLDAQRFFSRAMVCISRVVLPLPGNDIRFSRNIFLVLVWLGRG